MLLRIDTSSEESLFEQVASAVRTAIAQGETRAGDRLPSARELADSLGVNVHTVLHAYQELRNEGLIDLRRGRGAVVTDVADAIAQLNRDIVELGKRAKALGMSPATVVALVKASL